MKSLRTLIIPAAAAAALIVPAAVLAQQDAPPPANPPASGQSWQGRHGGFMRLFRNLNLSDAQKAQIEQIRKQFRQAHPQGSQPDPQARKQMRDQIMNVLTPAQRAQLTQEMQQMRAERMQRNGGTPPATPQP